MKEIILTLKIQHMENMNVMQKNNNNGNNNMPKSAMDLKAGSKKFYQRPVLFGGACAVGGAAVALGVKAIVDGVCKHSAKKKAKQASAQAAAAAPAQEPAQAPAPAAKAQK